MLAMGVKKEMSEKLKLIQEQEEAAKKEMESLKYLSKK